MEDSWKPQCPLRCHTGWGRARKAGKSFTLWLCEKQGELLSEVFLIPHPNKKQEKLIWSQRLALGVLVLTQQSHTRSHTACQLNKRIYSAFIPGWPEEADPHKCDVFQFYLHLFKNKVSDCHLDRAWRNVQRRTLAVPSSDEFSPHHHFSSPNFTSLHLLMINHLTGEK